MSFRSATVRDCHFIAEMIDLSSDGVALIEWVEVAQTTDNLAPLDIGAETYSSEAGDYSYRNCVIAEVYGARAGMLLSFPMQQRSSETIVSPPFDGRDVFAPYKYLEAPDTWYVCGVAVKPEYRGQGIGKKLMEKAREQAVAHGYDRLSLVVFEENTIALRLYQNMGYEIVDRAPIVPHPLIRCSGDALLMVAPTSR